MSIQYSILMGNESDDTSEAGLSRRRVLATFATSGSLGLSGCLSSISSYEPEQPEQEDTGVGSIPIIPELAWEFGTDGRILSSPVPVGDMLFVTSYDGRVYGLAGENKDNVQSADYSVFKTGRAGTNESGAGGPSQDVETKWEFSTHGRVIQTPIVRDEDVFFGSEDNYFYSVSAETGEENWRFNANRTVASASPAIVDGTVYVPTGNSTEMNEDGVLYALDAETGGEIWSTEFEGGLGAAPVVDNGRLYTGCQDDGYYALNAETGDVLWRFKADDIFCGSRAALMDGVIYAGSEDSSMYALDADDGSLVWEFETDDLIVSSPVATENAVYFGSYDYNLYAVDPETGDEIWSFETNNGIFSSPAYRDGIVYIGSNDGKLYAVHGETGEGIWRYDVGNSIKSSPVVTEDMIYFGADDNNVYAIEEREVDTETYREYRERKDDNVSAEEVGQEVRREIAEDLDEEERETLNLSTEE